MPPLLTPFSASLGSRGGTGIPTSIPLTNPIALLHFDGTDGQTTPITDEVGTMTWSATGTVQYDDAQKYFGPTAALFDGSGHIISTTSVNVGAPATGFTFEIWFRLPSAPPGTETPWAFTNAGSYSPCWMNFGQVGGGQYRVNMYSSKDGSNWDASSGGAWSTNITSNVWHHLAVCWDTVAAKLYGYVDGVKDFEHGPVAANAYNYATTSNSIGARAPYGNTMSAGWLDEFAVSTDCKYPGGITFTPPTLPYLV